MLKGSLERQLWLAPTVYNGGGGASAIVLRLAGNAERPGGGIADRHS